MYEYEEVRIKMDLIQKNLLEQVAGLHEIPEVHQRNLHLL